MKISKQARRDAKQLFRSCLANGLLDENRIRQAFQKVIEKKPRSFVQILSQLQRLTKLDIERRTARVESAAPLPGDLQTKIRENLAKAYGAGLSISFAENPALIGGLRIKVGSDVYDGTVQGKLHAIEQSFETV